MIISIIPQTLGWFQVSHKTSPSLIELPLQARQLCVDQARAQLEEAETKQKAPGNGGAGGKIMGHPVFCWKDLGDFEEILENSGKTMEQLW